MRFCSMFFVSFDRSEVSTQCRNFRSINWYKKTYHKISWGYHFKFLQQYFWLTFTTPAKPLHELFTTSFEVFVKGVLDKQYISKKILCVWFLEFSFFLDRIFAQILSHIGTGWRHWIGPQKEIIWQTRGKNLVTLSL
jgi:hypothetical protein